MLGLVIANRLCVEVFVLGWYIYAKMSEKFRAVVGVRWVKSLWAERTCDFSVCEADGLCCRWTLWERFLGKEARMSSDFRRWPAAVLLCSVVVQWRTKIRWKWALVHFHISGSQTFFDWWISISVLPAWFVWFVKNCGPYFSWVRCRIL